MVVGQDTRWQYSVTAAAADGRESLFDTVVEIHTPLNARLQVKGGTGPASLTVQFYDMSAGEVTAWAWDFDGDGLPDSTAQHPTHTFAAPGAHTVTLTVGGPEGTDTAIEVGAVEAR